MSSGSGGHIDFLSELNETDSLATLQHAQSEKSVLVFKIDTSPNPVTTYIENFSDKKAILPSVLREINIPADREVSIKFNIGSEIYFIKTFIKSHLNRYYFDMNSKVIQFKRRKEPRYFIPKKWTQNACIVLNLSKGIELKAKVNDISQSGIRFEIKPEHNIPAFHRDDILRLKFQIYKRGEIACTAIVRFVLNKPNTPLLIGFEFAEIADVQSKKVTSIIEDIKLFNSLYKK